jgi:hypothetical protein
MNRPRFKLSRPGLIALFLATAIWIPSMHFFFAMEVGNIGQPRGLTRVARRLAARQLLVWSDTGLRQQETARLRLSNPEWDLMARSFTAWSVAEIALRDPDSSTKYLNAMDGIIEDTLAAEREHGIYFCLGRTAKERSFVMQPARSQFLDGEIALMLASRRFVQEKPEYLVLLTDRVNSMARRMEQCPMLSAESYPDECWTFDNVIALCAIRLADCLDGTDHSSLASQWLNMAKRKLVDPTSGLLITNYTNDGRILKRPEATSSWMVAHCLRLLDEDFALEQYQRARKEFGASFAGFAWSRKEPAAGSASAILHRIDINAGASGLAFIGASSFHDDRYLSALAATLNFAGFPVVKDEQLHYCAGNQLGDAVLLYSLVLGPLWTQAEHRLGHE